MPRKATSPRAARSASKVLRDGRTSRHSKTAAGSALSQREKVGSRVKRESAGSRVRKKK